MTDKYVTNLLLGGVGNQLFEIAAGYTLAKELGFKYALCETNYIPIGGQGNTLPAYRDTLYSKIEFIPSIDNFLRYKAKSPNYYPLMSDLSNAQTSISLKGHFQSERNFVNYKDEIRDLFTPAGGFTNWLLESGFEYPELFDDHEFVFIGVRRGDYLKEPRVHNPCGMKYYEKSMKLLPAARYYVASDDIEWCKRNFMGPQFVFFDITMKNDLQQLAAMTLFKKYIISNSSFYWWGSYLSIHTKPTVIAPDKWISPLHNRDMWKKDYIYRDDMIIVERHVEVA